MITSLKLIQMYIISSGDPLLRSTIDEIISSEKNEDEKISTIKAELERHHQASHLADQKELSITSA